MPDSTSPNMFASGLFTDLYELTMAQVQLATGMTEPAVFSLAVRKLPEARNFLLACGQGTLLADLERFSFAADDIAYLRGLGRFSDDFLGWLGHFRFRGRVRAVPEGTPVFADEPLLELEAALPEAQILETLVINQIHLQTTLASKAARIVHAAAGRPVYDFGARRMHGIDAAAKGARAYHIAGLAGTSNLQAGRLWDLPVVGTMAHSFVQACASEEEAFRRFTTVFPETVLLIDTYDTLRGCARVIALAKDLGEDFRVKGVRLDSGDLGALAKDVRAALDRAGLGRVQIIASGGLDEHTIARLVAEDAPIDGFGVGSAMGVSADAPVLDIAYKLCAYGGEGRMKLSTGKPVLPGAKQVFRDERAGRVEGDVVARAEETPTGRPLLQVAMEDGRRVPAFTSDIGPARRRAAREIERLPAAVRTLSPADPPFPVAISPCLDAYRREIAERYEV